MDIVEHSIVQNQLQTRFKNDRSGQDWFTNFTMRYHFSLNKPRSIEYERCDLAIPREVRLFRKTYWNKYMIVMKPLDAAVFRGIKSA